MEFEYCPVCGTKSLYSVRNLDWKHMCNRCLNIFAIMDIEGQQGFIIKNDPIENDPILDQIEEIWNNRSIIDGGA